MSTRDPVRSKPGAPTSTSLYPSAFGSPAEPTDQPNLTSACAGMSSGIQPADEARPAEDPWYTNARPVAVPPYDPNGSPTITSLNPSPFTSPADATDQPNWVVVFV